MIQAGAWAQATTHSAKGHSVRVALIRRLLASRTACLQASGNGGDALSLQHAQTPLIGATRVC